MGRVIVTRSMVGICGMQVCAVKDASDNEILEVCNSGNLSGTRNGWTEVIRSIDKESLFKTERSLPVVCDKDKERLHFLVLC